MSELDRFHKLVGKYQPEHHCFFERQHLGRRCFFRNTLTGIGGFFLADGIASGQAEIQTQGAVEVKNTARNVIFLFLRGAPSHVDTFDFKNVPGVTPSNFAPEAFNGVTLPTRLLGNTSRVLNRVAIIRSGLAWARAHPLAQVWMQIGRNPTSPTGRIAPHIGSVVAIEKDFERRPDQVFPTFIALNANNISKAGYFSSTYGPFITNPARGGLTSTAHAAGRAVYEERWNLLQQMNALDSQQIVGLGDQVASIETISEQANRMMFNPAVEAAFQFTEEEHLRYGSTNFGDAVLTARKIMEQDQGTRFIQVDLGGWDHHGDIYSIEQNKNIYAQCGAFDPAFAALIEDLETAGKLNETLIVVCGEFGRTPGNLSSERRGRDHYLQMFFLLAGGGIQGGQVIGATNDQGGQGPGAFTTEPGWSRERDIRPEDIEATIYSALGIDWTTIRRDDPLNRGFYYVPLSEDDAYMPVHELWGSS